MGPAIAAYISAAAACLAVGASALNVVLTARLTRSTQLESWRRDRLYPLCLAVYKASRAYQPSIERITKIVDARREHRRLGSPPPEFAGYSEAMEASAHALADMKAEVAEVELLGPVDLAKAARQVVDSSSYLDRAVSQYAHIAELDADHIDPEDLNADDYRGLVIGCFTTANKAETQFLEEARTRLGVRW